MVGAPRASSAPATLYTYNEVVFDGSSNPLIETHLAVMRGLPTKKFLPESVNEKSSTERRS